MLILIFCVPAGLLALYLSWLGWRKNRRASLVLLLFALLTLGLSAVTANFLYFTRRHWGF